MARILITGGTGVLGRQLTPRLQAAGHTVRIMSRGPRKAGFDPGIEWAQSGLAPGPALAKALAEVDAVIHAASTPVGARKVEVDGTRTLLDACAQAGIGHFMYISIVGVDHFPKFAYYQAKLAAEKVIETHSVPWTILRATQFHELLDERFTPPLFMLPGLALIPLDFKFQLIDSGEVAGRMVELVSAGPSGRAADIGGPEVLEWASIAKQWMQAHGKNRRLVRLPWSGSTPTAFRHGHNTCPEAPYGRVTFEAYLDNKYGRRTR
jgi:uncharacterized protein YbjT (DUF2867 family)